MSDRRPAPGRERFWLTPRGIAVSVVGGALLVGAYLLERNELLIAGSACALLVVTSILATRLRRPRLGVSRDFGHEVAVMGRPRSVLVRLENRGSRATPSLRLVDRVPWREATEPLTLPPIPSSSRRRTVELGYTLHPPRRGRFAIGPLAAEHDDWFGLARERIELGGVDSLLVVPDLAELSGDVLRPAQGDGTEVLARSVVAGRDDDLSTREYRPGDALRRVHWRASARHGELMVRQEEAHSTTIARLLIDTRRDGYPDLDAGVSPDFEWVVRMLGSLALHLDRLGYRLDFAESSAGDDGPEQLEPIDGLGDSSQRSRSLLLSLAEIQPMTATRPPAPPAGIGDDPGPLYAMLGDPSDATIDWITASRSPGVVPVAFLSARAASAALRLHELGWAVVRYEPDAPLDAAWLLTPGAR